MADKYICNKCKESLYDFELNKVEGGYSECCYYGEHVDWRYEGDDYVCPHCGSDDLIEAVECPICGGFHDKEESYGGYCEKCVDKAATPENLIEWCEVEEETETVEINAAIMTMVRELKIDINDLLKEVINESVYKDRLEKVCKESIKEEFDTEFFMKWFKERG